MTGIKNQSLEPSYVDQITSMLEEKIREGRFRGSYWLPTERSLAEEYRVSRTRIRQALAELERRNLVIREAGCRTAIRREIEASSVPDTSRHSIGLAIPNFPHYSGAHMIARGVQRALDGCSYRLVLSSPCGKTIEEDIQTEAGILTQMASDEDIAGLIIWYNGGQANLPYLAELRSRNIPMVFVDRLPPSEFESDYVGIDNRNAAQETVEHLLELGHRRILHITNFEPVSSVYERMDGYRDALISRGIEIRPEYILSGEVEGLEGEELNADILAEKILSLPDRPTAIFAVTDYIAITLMKAMQSKGVRIPEDIAIAGFDDLERWSLQTPFLTTVRQPFERIGKEAVKLLEQRIKGDRTPAYRQRLLDAQLIVRESTRGTS